MGILYVTFMCIDGTYPRIYIYTNDAETGGVSEGPHCVYIFLDSSLIQ